MKRILLVLLMIPFLISCAGSSRKKNSIKNEKNTLMPSWIRTINNVDGYFIGIAAEKSTHLDYAFKRAIQKSFSEIVKDIEAKLEGFSEYTREEVNDSFKDELHYAYELSMQRSLTGIRILKQEVKKEGFYYYVFMIAGIPQSLFASNLEQISASNSKINQTISTSTLFKKWKSAQTVNVFNQSKKKLKKTYFYPEWFLQQLEKGGKEAFVGYSNNAYYKENAVPLAIQNGLENFLLFTQNHAKGTLVNYLRWNENFIESGEYKEDINKGIIGQLEKNFAVLDTAYLKEMTLVLLGHGKVKSDKIVALTKVPEWVVNIPMEKDYYYVVGVSPKFEYEKNSWLDAEKDARKKLALYKMTSLSGKEYFTEKLSMGINYLNLDVKLTGVQVIARARDDYLMYVLARIKK